MTLLAFAAERRAAGRFTAASDDRHRLLAGRTAANPPHAAAAGEWDRQTDAVPLHDPAAYSAASDDADKQMTIDR